MFRKMFLDHPRSIGESYAEHAGVALSFAGVLVTASVACFVHAVIPGLFETTGSRAVARLHERMVSNRARRGVDSVSRRIA